MVPTVYICNCCPEILVFYLASVGFYFAGACGRRSLLCRRCGHVLGRPIGEEMHVYGGGGCKAKEDLVGSG